MDEQVSATRWPGGYVAAAQAAREAFEGAPPGRRYELLGAWEEHAYAMRPVGDGTPHPSVVGVIDAITAALAAEPLDEVQQAMLRARRMRHYCWSWPATYRAEAEAEVERARGLASPEPLAYSLFALHTAMELPAELPRALAISEDLVGLTQRHRSPVIRAMGHWRRYVDCLLAADSAGRDAHLAALVRACGETADRYWDMVATMCRADHEISGGNFGRGEELLGALRTSLTEFPGLLTAAVATLSVILRGARGQVAPDAPISRTATGARVLHPAFRIGLAYTLSLSGRTTEAAAELEGIDFENLRRDGGYLPSLAMVIDMAIDHFGDRALAEKCYRLLLPYAGMMVVTGPGQGTWGPGSLYLGRAAAFLGLPAAADHLRQARSTAAAMRARPALALALLELGLQQREEGDPAGAAMIEEALSIAGMVGMASTAARARAALRTAPARRRAPAAATELSQREREVLALIARGHTAAEVASQLVLSRRTVEKHLEHAYAKIGARNRAEGITWAIVNGLTQDP